MRERRRAAGSRHSHLSVALANRLAPRLGQQ